MNSFAHDIRGILILLRLATTFLIHFLQPCTFSKIRTPELHYNDVLPVFEWMLHVVKLPCNEVVLTYKALNNLGRSPRQLYFIFNFSFLLSGVLRRSQNPSEDLLSKFDRKGRTKKRRFMVSLK